VRDNFPIAKPARWFATFAGSVGAAYFAALVETDAVASAPPQDTSVASKQTGNHGGFREDRKDRTMSAANPSSAAWLRVPARWMDHYRATVGRREFHRLLKLDHTEGERLEHAADEAMKLAKSRQIAAIEDLVMTEGRTLLIPALDDEAIATLIRSVIAALPGNLSAAEYELAAFLMERELRKEYGKDLKVSLEFTGGISSKDLTHLPSHLVGYRYVVRPIGSRAGERVIHHSVGGSGRFDFLELDPELSNEGRNPLNQ